MIETLPLVGIIDWGSLLEFILPTLRSLAPPILPPEIFEQTMEFADMISFS